jgi:transposase
MSYIVEQKIKGRIYLYQAESYWDKEKKQPRQRRTYIGPKNKKNKSKIKPKKSCLINKNYGNIFLLKFVSKQLGLTKILKSVFPQRYSEIMALSYYEIMEGSPLYLFPYWLDEQYLDNVKKLHSSSISKLCDELGRSQIQRLDFVHKWINCLKPIKGIYYDITSISSYSTNIDFIEWGYNRDHENLPQLNMGVTFCQNNSLPIYYNLYPGSIVDVTTLKNCIKYLKIFNLKDILFVLDRGFFSKSNVLEMNNNENKIEFIQPLPFTLKSVKKLLKKYKRQLKNPSNSFKFKEEILYYLSTTLEFDSHAFNADLFFNEKSEVEQKHNFLKTLFDFEEKLKNKKFITLKEYLKYRETNIPNKLVNYFKWNKTTLGIEKNMKTIKSNISKMGCFVLLTNKPMNRMDVLNYYRQRDGVEKIFDVVKNEMDGGRLRAHSQYNIDGRLFIKFIALIIYTEVTKIMRKNNLFEKHSVKELLAELKKLKIVKIEKNDLFLSELSKRQKLIIKSFGIKEESLLHSY